MQQLISQGGFAVICVNGGLKSNTTGQTIVSATADLNTVKVTDLGYKVNT